MLVATACAPHLQGRLPSNSDEINPRLEEDRVVSFDGAALGLQTWTPEGEDAPWAAIVAVHGMSEYSDAWWMAGPWWAERGIAVYAYDQRGFGRSPNHGLWPKPEVMYRDLTTVIELVRARHPDAVIAAVGQSMGAATIAGADQLAPAPIADRVVLSAPAVRGWSNLPPHYSASLWTVAHVAPGLVLRPPANLDIRASDNDEALYRNGRDPLYLHDTRADVIYGLVGHMERAARAQPGRDGPTFVIYGANDQIIPPEAVERLSRRFGPCASSAFYPSGWHMLFRDLQAETVWRDVEAFLRDPAQPPPSGASPIFDAAPTESLSCSVTLRAEDLSD